jgi:hypothetical protein
VYCRKIAPELTKLERRSERSRLMGREPGTKGWREFLETGSIAIGYDCIFVEGRAAEDSDNNGSHSHDESAEWEIDGEHDAAAADGKDVGAEVIREPADALI